ncbi:MAG: helix-turn-helix transcriptional regulator [Solirubrobacteraceae bacterium]
MRTESIDGQPHPLLRGHVMRYGGFTEDAPLAIRRREVAFSGVAVILALEGTWELTDPARDGAWCTRQSFVGGLVGGPVLVDHTGFTLTLQFDLTPLGARQLLGVPGADLAGQVVDVADVLGDAGRVLVERLRELGSWPARFRALDGFLLERLSKATPVSADVSWAWRRLVDADGDIRIGTLVTELGCSGRHLSRRFMEEIGMTPKAYARVLRFERAMRLLTAGEEPGDVAFACGYADQPHFNREFLAMAGVPPRVAYAERAP